MTDMAEKFWEGAGALRNARNWAKEQRDRVIAAANARLPIAPVNKASQSFGCSQLSISTEKTTLSFDALIDGLAIKSQTTGPSDPTESKTKKRHRKSALETNCKSSKSVNQTALVGTLSRPRYCSLLLHQSRQKLMEAVDHILILHRMLKATQ